MGRFMAGRLTGADYRMQNAAMLHAGKSLTEPLLIVLIIAVPALLVSMRHRPARRSSAVALATLLMLAIFSTRCTSELLERSLLIGDVTDGSEPRVIVVAAGGLLDSVPVALSGSSESRVAAGVEWWRQHPKAILVMAGADARPEGLFTATIELMRENAIRAGVPPSSILLEARSTNTREHALGLLRLPGVTPDTPIGVVTSDWHMRRTLREFRRHFKHVSSHAAETSSRPPIHISDWIPSSQSLRVSTRLLHEWLGIAWYALRR
jgi:uncharacterized SAM-binding protein YcdF (DUF218 family)